MDAQVARTGLSESRLERIAEHLNRAYVEIGRAHV